MCLALGLFVAIVTFDNIVDYGANHAFVRHVMSMDTTLPGNALMGLAVTRPALWQAAYALIILGEGVTAISFLAAAGALWWACRAQSAAFQRAEGLAHVAETAGFLVWFLGFELIGREYFAMWQSSHWNGQEAAFRFYDDVGSADLRQPSGRGGRRGSVFRQGQEADRVTALVSTSTGR